MVVNVRRQTLKDINNSMKGTTDQAPNPFKIMKMINGDDVICKIMEEYTDALVVEYPMSIVKNQVMESEDQIVEHTGLQRWMNYTHDSTFVIPKERIITLANMAPDVTMYYKHVCKRLAFETKLEPSNTEEAMEKMKENIDRLTEIMGDGDGDESGDKLANVIPFVPMDKSKLH